MLGNILGLSSRFKVKFSLTNAKICHSTIRCFHATAGVYGRKTGSSALEPGPRNWSKSQMKRHAAAVEARNKKIKTGDYGKNKMQLDAAMRKMKGPDMTDYLDKLQEELFPGVRELMLPDGSSLLNTNDDDSLLGYNIDTSVVIRELQENVTLLERRSCSTGTDIQPVDVDTIHQLEDDAYIAMKLLGNENKFEEMTVLLNLLKRMETLQREHANVSAVNSLPVLVNVSAEPMTIPVAVYNEYLRVAFELKRYNLIEEMFVKDISVEMESDDFQSPSMIYKQQADMSTWSWYLQAMAKNGNPDNALKEIDRLEKIPSLHVTTDMYNAVLDMFVESKRFEDAYALWERMHVTPDLKLNNESFVSILKYCTLTNQSERAFYVYDEMKALDLSPTAAVFAELFKACGEAPQYVHGYEDTIEEAMCLMEGCEIFPTREVYENILHAYSVPGDVISAEFYFWEMKRKGLEVTATAYANLLLAHSRNSSLGLKKWGYNQRFVKKQERLTEDQKLVRKIPPAKMAKLMSEDVFSDEDNESRYRMGEAVIAKGGGRKKPIIHDHMSGNVDEAEEYMEKLRKESDKYPDLDYSDKDPYEQLYGGKMEDLPMSVEKGVLSQLESVSSIDVPKKKTFDANIHELMSDMGEMDVNNMDINSFMKNPSLINNMLGEFSSEEKDEFSSLLTQFGMSGDIDAVVGDLFGTDDSKFKVSAPSAVPTSLATGGGDEMSEDEAKAMMELLQGGKPGVAPQSFPTTPDSADNVSEFNFDGNNDDREAFDELMQQLSRIETQTEGKVTLDNLMQQFMMEEGANMSDDSQEDQPLESMQTNRTDEFDFLQEDGNSPSDMSGGDRLASHRNDDAENDRGGHGFKKGRRLVPTLPMELVEFQPPATKSALGELDVASTAQKLASMLDDGGMNTQGKPSESSGDGELCLASRNNEGDLAPSESPAANDISSLIDIFSEGLTPDQKVVSTEAINFEWDRMEFGRVEEACDYASIDVLHRRLRNVEKSEIIFAHMIESGIEPTVDSVNALLANYTESLMSTGAVQIMEDMFARGNKYDLVPNSTTYQHLVRMYLRKKDMDNVLQTMDEMKALNINPTPETWGLVIDAYASRNKPVEALKVIEEVATSDPAVIKLIPDGYLKRIHALCRKLAVMHPSLPPDPEDWVRDVRVQRRRMKLASKSKIQPLRSYLYT